MSIKEIFLNNASYLGQQVYSAVSLGVKAVDTASHATQKIPEFFQAGKNVNKEIQRQEGSSFSAKAVNFAYNKYVPAAVKQAIPQATRYVPAAVKQAIPQATSFIDKSKEMYSAIQTENGENIVAKTVNHLAAQYIPPAIQASIPSRPGQIAAKLAVDTLQKTTGIEGFKISHANGQESIYRFDNTDIPAAVEPNAAVQQPQQNVEPPQVEIAAALQTRINANLTPEKIATAKQSVLNLCYDKLYPKLTTYLQSFVAFSFGLNKSLDDNGFYNNILMHVVKESQQNRGVNKFSPGKFIEVYNAEIDSYNEGRVQNRKANITLWQKVKIYAFYLFTTIAIRALVPIIINNVINNFFNYLFAENGEKQEHILSKVTIELSDFLHKYHLACINNPNAINKNKFLDENISDGTFLGKYKTTEKGIEITKDLNYRILVEGVSKFILDKFFPKSTKIAKESITYIKRLKNTNRPLYASLVPFILPLQIHAWTGWLLSPIIRFILKKILHVFVPSVVTTTKEVLQDKGIQNIYYKSIYKQILLNKSLLQNIDRNGNNDTVPFKAYANPEVKEGLKNISITLGKIVTTLAPNVPVSENESSSKLIKLMELLDYIPGIEKKQIVDLSLNKVYEEVLPLILNEIFNIYMHPEGMAELLNIILDSTSESFAPNSYSKKHLKSQTDKLENISGIDQRVITFLRTIEANQEEKTSKLTLSNEEKARMRTAILYLTKLSFIPSNIEHKEPLLTIVSELVNISFDMKMELMESIKDLCINDTQKVLAEEIENVIRTGKIGEAVKNFKVNPNNHNDNTNNNLLDINKEITDLITPIALNQAETGLDIILDQHFIQGLFNTIFKSSLDN